MTRSKTKLNHSDPTRTEPLACPACYAPARNVAVEAPIARCLECHIQVVGSEATREATVVAWNTWCERVGKAQARRARL